MKTTVSSTLPSAFHTRIVPILVLGFCLLAVVSAKAAPQVWSGANTATDFNWSDGANWSNGVAPALTSDVYFLNPGATGGEGPAGTADNIVDLNFAIESLWFTNSVYGSGTIPHTTLINPGATLTITGALANAIFVGNTSDVSTQGSVYATINGPGAALVVTNPSGTLSVRQGEVNSGATATLDLRGLDTFTASVSQILAAGENIGKNVGTLYLANTNYITCLASGTTPGFIVGNNNTSGSKTTKSYLGVTNVILADGGMEIPSKRMTSSLVFNSSGSAAYFRNHTGTGPQDHWYIGFNNTSGTGTGCSGLADFSLGVVDAMMNTLIVGQGETSGSSGSTATGNLNFYGGSIVAGNVDIGSELITVNPGNGTITMNDDNAPAQFTVNGTLRLGRHVSGGNANSGTLTVTGSGNASVTVNGNIVGGGGSSTLSFNTSALTLTGTMGAAGAGQGPISSFSFTGGTLTLNLGAGPNPVTAVCSVTSATLAQPITLNVLGSALSVGQFSLLQYQSLGGDGFNAFTTVNLPAQVQGYLSNNVTASSIDLVITNIFAPIWNGQTNGISVGVWDVNTTPDWKTSAGAALKYQQTSVPGNQVTFNDSASGTTTVNLTTTLEPASIGVNNSAKNYTFTGAGQLSGPASLLKNGTGSLTLANTGQNNFTGPISIVGGTVQLGVANGLPTNGAVTLADTAGATLNLNSFNQELAALSGGGADGGGNVTLGSGTLMFATGSSGNYSGIINGAGRVVVTNSATQILAGPNTYGGGTLVSTGTFVADNISGSATGSGTVDVEGGTLQIGNADSGAGAVAANVITNNGTVVFDRADAFTFTNLVTGTGGLIQEGAGAVTITVANTFTGPTTISGGALQISNSRSLGGTNSTVTVSFGGSPNLQLAGGITVYNPVAVTSKGGALNGNFPVVENVSGSNTLAGPLEATSSGTDLVFMSDADKLILSGGFSYATAGSHQVIRIRGSGNGEWHGSITNAGGSIVQLAKQDSGTWVVTSSSTNTYTDITAVVGGTLIMDGQVLNSSLVDVAAGATLGGTGLIAVPVTLEDSSTLFPGDSGIGTLTIRNGLTMLGNSTIDLELSEGPGGLSNSQITGLTNITYSGTLQVTLDTPLSGGEIFHLFNSTTYNGAFFTINLPTLPSPLSWDTSQLAVDGTLRVDGGVYVASITHSGTSSQIGLTGAAGQTFHVFATTNLTIPFSNWVQVGVGTISPSDTATFSDTSATNHQRFYRFVAP